MPPKIIRRKIVRRKRIIRRKKVVNKSRQPTRAFTKMVQAVVSRNIENKIYQAHTVMPLYYVSPTNDVMEWRGLFPLTPYTATGAPIDSTISIVQGTSQRARIGNVIRTKRAVLKGIILPYPQGSPLNPEPRPMEICMWIFKLKGFASTGALGDTLGGAEHVLENHFLQNATAGGTSEGLTGELMDVLRPVNQDVVQLLYKRVFKVGWSEVYSSNQGNLANNQKYMNNDFKYNEKFSINVTDYIPKIIKYNDNDDTPNIKNTYCMIAPYNADGVTSTNSSIVPAVCHWSLEYTYEDA